MIVQTSAACSCWQSIFLCNLSCGLHAAAGSLFSYATYHVLDIFLHALLLKDKKILLLSFYDGTAELLLKAAGSTECLPSCKTEGKLRAVQRLGLMSQGLDRHIKCTQ
jgi:hypothetical protein